MKRFLKSFAKARRGSVSLSGGLLLTVVAGASGAAVDYSNAQSRRVDLQSAADAAALAGASRLEMPVEEIQELAKANLRNTPTSGTATVTATRDAEGQVNVEIAALSPTFILGIVGVHGVEVSAKSAAVFVPEANGKIEVALVLDTTQSMADDMDALRTSAQQLADTLFSVGGENVKVSIVPYVASVNVGNGATQLAWMDTAGNAPYHGYSQRGWDLTKCNAPPPTGSSSSSGGTSSGGTPPPSCNATCGCPGELACGGGDDGASVFGMDAAKYAGNLLGEVFGAPEAEAAPLSYPTPDPNSCPVKNPVAVNYFDLFDTIANTSWMGCVEARPAPHDVTDTDPMADGANSRFVPYFWPDEADWLDDDPADTWANNYIDDIAAGPTFDDTIQYFPTWSGRRRVNVWKYNDQTASIDETTPDVSGPNRACPDPMLPLTSDQTTVTNKISSLTHRNGGGTIISEGVMWGWRAISPGAPFTEGTDYDDETRKIIIVMSDGANAVSARTDDTGQPADETMGDYTAYGFGEEFNQKWPSRGLVDTTLNTSTPYFEQVRDALNERTLTACTNVKNAGTEDNPVEIYTVLVGNSDESTEEVMASCATTRSNHYKEVSEMSVLQEAFGEVASEIAGKGSSRLVY